MDNYLQLCIGSHTVLRSTIAHAYNVPIGDYILIANNS